MGARITYVRFRCECGKGFRMEVLKGGPRREHQRKPERWAGCRDTILAALGREPKPLREIVAYVHLNFGVIRAESVSRQLRKLVRMKVAATHRPKGAPITEWGYYRVCWT